MRQVSASETHLLVLINHTNIAWPSSCHPAFNATIVMLSPNQCLVQRKNQKHAYKMHDPTVDSSKANGRASMNPLYFLSVLCEHTGLISLVCLGDPFTSIRITYYPGHFHKSLYVLY